MDELFDDQEDFDAGVEDSDVSQYRHVQESQNALFDERDAYGNY